MISTIPTYYQGESAKTLPIDWPDADGLPYLLASNWTFALDVVGAAGTVMFTKSTGIVGANEFPNLVVTWSTVAGQEIAGLAPGDYTVRVTATRGGGGELKGRCRIRVLAF